MVIKIFEFEHLGSKKMLNNNIQRNFGLDIIRSFAIIMVLASHIIYDGINHKYNTAIAMSIGFLGVELFFVLSGFLIGKILIKLFSNGINALTIRTFYIRRWLRTLPLYYLALFVNILSVKLINPGINIFSNFYLKYLIFIQNFDIGHYNFFPQSWSLSIEEWFYLLLPFILWIFYLKGVKSEKLYINIFKIIIFIMIIRFFYVLLLNPSVDFGIRRFIPIRFDSLLIGVLFSCLKINNKQILNTVLNKKTLIISIVIALIVLISNSFHNAILFKINTVLVNSFIWSFVSFVFGVLIIFFENNNFINKKLSKFSFIKNFFEKTSIYSYSIYLFHGIILTYYVDQAGLFNNHKQLFMPILLYLVTLYFFSAFIYRYYEKPIMDLREKFKKE